MIFSFHNKLTVKMNGHEYYFYNTVLPSTLNKLSNFEKYNEYLSVGNGQANSESQNLFNLTSHVATAKLIYKSIQSDITKGSLFGKYQYKLTKSELSSINYLTEAGLSDGNSTPTIFNYFSLISEDNPNGLNISTSDEILFEVIINLTINENNQILLTSGENPFIEFLLGNGLGEVYACCGSNFAENVRMSREVPNNKTYYPCTKTCNIENNTLTLNLSLEITNKEIDEILFFTDTKVFARKNLKEYQTPESQNLTLTPKANYVIKIDSDIKTVTSITNQTTQATETNFYVSKYANSFGDKISLPFNNIFNSTTSRFLSKDGKLIFFISNNKVYAYKNEDFKIIELNTKEIDDDYISKIISFENYVFIISKIKPFISTYIVSNNVIKKVENNFESFEKYSEFENLFQVDITLCKNNKFMLGIIQNNKTALTIYFTYNESTGFVTGNHLTNSRNFNFILGMYKNNFCDGRMIYLKEGETSALCRIVTHSADETETDIYSSLAFTLTQNSTNIYTKGRAIIAEKNTSPSVVIFYYPQIYEYELPLISTEQKDYISSDLNYLIQKTESNEYKIYNLVGYDTPEEFSDGLQSILQYSQIVDFEFMKDSILIFTNMEDQPIIAYNLNLNKTQIENLSNKTDEYNVSIMKYKKLGSNGETVKFKIETRIEL